MKNDYKARLAALELAQGKYREKVATAAEVVADAAEFHKFLTGDKTNGA